MNLGTNPLETPKNIEPNKEWLEKCAYFIYKARLDWKVKEDKDQDMEWAKQIAMKHQDRSSQSKWTPEDDKLVADEMAHQAFWRTLKPLE